MSSEYFYTKTKFTERLALLSSQKGIEFKEMKNLPRILARRIVESGVIPVHEFEDKGYVLENTRILFLPIAFFRNLNTYSILQM